MALCVCTRSCITQLHHDMHRLRALVASSTPQLLLWCTYPLVFSERCHTVVPPITWLFALQACMRNTSVLLTVRLQWRRCGAGMSDLNAAGMLTCMAH